MKSLRRCTPITVVMIGALTLAGCAGADQKTNLTAQGAGIGAVGGAVLGGLLGGGRGALIGAGIGAAAGGLAGYGLGTEQEKFASAEQELAVRTDRARQIANTQRQEAENARAAAASYEASLAPLRRQVANRQALNTQQRATRSRPRSTPAPRRWTTSAKASTRCAARARTPPPWKPRAANSRPATPASRARSTA
jgi:outer membrane lipoprotein SlyB